MKNRFLFLKIRLGLYAAVSLFFVLLPCEVAERGSICLIYNLYGVKCLTCGVTRGVTNFFHGNFLRAWQYNPLTYAVVLIFFLLILSDLYLLICFRKQNPPEYFSIFERIWRWVFASNKK